MHQKDKAREDADVTRYETVDTIRMVECAVSNMGDNREIEVSHITEVVNLVIKVKAW